MSKKILICTWSLKIGGAEKSLINLLNLLSKQQLDITLFLFEKTGDLLSDIPSNVKIVDVSNVILFLTNRVFNVRFNSAILKCLILKLKFIIFLKRESKSNYNKDQKLWQFVWSKCIQDSIGEFDLAIGYLQGIPSYYVIEKVNAVKKVLWIHHDYSELISDIDFDRKMYSKANFVINVSNECKKNFDQIIPLEIEKSIIIHNLFINNQIKEANLSISIKPKQEVKHKIVNILSVGRLEKIKGFDIAIEAAFELKKEGINFKWIIIGDGSEYKKLNSLIDKYTLNGDVFLVGKIVDPYKFYMDSDILVQSSLKEGKSVVLDEAKFFNLPIICTNYSSSIDQISNRVNGIIVKIDALSIKEGIKELIQNSILYNDIKGNLKREVFHLLEMEQRNQLIHLELIDNLVSYK